MKSGARFLKLPATYFKSRFEKIAMKIEGFALKQLKQVEKKYNRTIIHNLEFSPQLINNQGKSMVQ